MIKKMIKIRKLKTRVSKLQNVYTSNYSIATESLVSKFLVVVEIKTKH